MRAHNVVRGEAPDNFRGVASGCPLFRGKNVRELQRRLDMRSDYVIVLLTQQLLSRRLASFPGSFRGREKSLGTS